MFTQLIELNIEIGKIQLYILNNEKELTLRVDNLVEVKKQLQESKITNMELIQNIKYVRHHKKKVRFTDKMKKNTQEYIEKLNESLTELNKGIKNKRNIIIIGL